MIDATTPLATITADGQEIVLRMLSVGDQSKLLAFSSALPAHDLLFLPEDITDEAVIDAWVADAAQRRAPTVLAEAVPAIVGCASVSVSRAQWAQHVAEIRVIVAESLRGQGLGRSLMTEAFRVAVDMGISKMIAQMTINQDGARRMFRRMGLQTEAILRDHVRDREGELHDLVILSHLTAQFLATLGLTRDEAGAYRLAVPAPLDPDELDQARSSKR